MAAGPLAAGSYAGGGLGVTEVRSDGIDPTIERLLLPGFGGSGRLTSGVSVVFDGPRIVHAVAPGEPLTYLVSVRNTWPITIRLMGRWRDGVGRTDATEPNATTPTGLSLLRDPSVLDASPAGTTPFEPVELAPGAEVTVVVAETARDCADPTKVLPTRDGSESFTVPKILLVYEAFGIEGVGTVGLSPEVTVPSNCP
jgi:hypothetical protein